jgi:hypothetical protein
MRFDQAYDSKRVCQLSARTISKISNSNELIREEWCHYVAIWQELLKQDDWTAPTKDYRENFSAIKIKEIDADGKESYVIKEYSPELLKELEKDPTLAYSDAFYGIDPNEGVNGLYFNAIHDGRVLDEATGKLADVGMTRLFALGFRYRSTSMLGMFDVNLDRVLRTIN